MRWCYVQPMRGEWLVECGIILLGLLPVALVAMLVFSNWDSLVGGFARAASVWRGRRQPPCGRSQTCRAPCCRAFSRHRTGCQNTAWREDLASRHVISANLRRCDRRVCRGRSLL